MQSKRIKVVSGKNEFVNAWRVALPKKACRRLGIRPGDAVQVTETESGFSVEKTE
jgi:AbrB family looped-hinge helix DNA binding protein